MNVSNINVGLTGEDLLSIYNDFVSIKELNIESIEIYLVKYRNFDWINCSDEELQDARSNVTTLLDLARKIEKEFRRI